MKKPRLRGKRSIKKTINQGQFLLYDEQGQVYITLTAMAAFRVQRILQQLMTKTA
jgi:hypothetical protein